MGATQEEKDDGNAFKDALDDLLDEYDNKIQTHSVTTANKSKHSMAQVPKHLAVAANELCLLLQVFLPQQPTF